MAPAEKALDIFMRKNFFQSKSIDFTATDKDTIEELAKKHQQNLSNIECQALSFTDDTWVALFAFALSDVEKECKDRTNGKIKPTTALKNLFDTVSKELETINQDYDKCLTALNSDLSTLAENAPAYFTPLTFNYNQRDLIDFIFDEKSKFIKEISNTNYDLSLKANKPRIITLGNNPSLKKQTVIRTIIKNNLFKSVNDIAELVNKRYPLISQDTKNTCGNIYATDLFKIDLLCTILDILYKVSPNESNKILSPPLKSSNAYTDIAPILMKFNDDVFKNQTTQPVKELYPLFINSEKFLTTVVPTALFPLYIFALDYAFNTIATTKSKRKNLKIKNLSFILNPSILHFVHQINRQNNIYSHYKKHRHFFKNFLTYYHFFKNKPSPFSQYYCLWTLLKYSQDLKMALINLFPKEFRNKICSSPPTNFDTIKHERTLSQGFDTIKHELTLPQSFTGLAVFLLNDSLSNDLIKNFPNTLSIQAMKYLKAIKDRLTTREKTEEDSHQLPFAYYLFQKNSLAKKKKWHYKLKSYISKNPRSSIGLLGESFFQRGLTKINVSAFLIELIINATEKLRLHLQTSSELNNILQEIVESPLRSDTFSAENLQKNFNLLAYIEAIFDNKKIENHNLCKIEATYLALCKYLKLKKYI